MENLNPFTERGVIRDPKRFFGRKRELDQIFQRLAAMQSVSIVGERRIGKSSLLYYIFQATADKLGKGYECRYIDLQLVKDAEAFFSQLKTDLKAENPDGLSLQRAIENSKVVLCLDEFERSESFSKDFSNVLRGLASTGSLALVTASQRKLVELAEVGATTSPFYNIFDPVLRLEEMNEEETAQLLKGLGEPAGYTFKPEEINEAYRVTKGNPWKLQIFGYHLFEAKDLLAAQDRYEKAIANYQPDRVALPIEEEASVSVDESAGARNITQSASYAQLSMVLLVLAAIIAFVSIVLNFVTPGMIAAVALMLISLLLQARRGAGR